MRVGLLEMRPGDYLFGRNELGSGSPQDDVLIAWSVGGCVVLGCILS